MERHQIKRIFAGEYLKIKETMQRETTLTDWKVKFVGSTALKPKKVYTGNNMIGIAQIPKSNAIPVFNPQQAKDTVKVK